MVVEVVVVEVVVEGFQIPRPDALDVETREVVEEELVEEEEVVEVVVEGVVEVVETCVVTEMDLRIGQSSPCEQAEKELTW